MATSKYFFWPCPNFGMGRACQTHSLTKFGMATSKYFFLAMSKLWHGYKRTYFCHILPLTIFGYDQSLAWPLHDINQTGPKAMMHFSIK
jgi:hypothetical protein